MKRTFLKNCEGIAAVEFALIAPILIFLMVGIFDFGSYLNTLIKLESTSRAAAEYILHGGNEDGIRDEILLPSNLNLNEDTVDDVAVDITHSWECSGGAQANIDTDCGEGDYLRQFIEVSLTMEYAPAIAFAGLVRSLTLTGKVKIQNN